MCTPAHVFAASPADLLASRVGDAEKKVAALFEAARRCAPSVVILEDVESLAPASEPGSSPSEPPPGAGEGLRRDKRRACRKHNKRLGFSMAVSCLFPFEKTSYGPSVWAPFFERL